MTKKNPTSNRGKSKEKFNIGFMHFLLLFTNHEMCLKE